MLINEGCNSRATVVQVLQDLLYVLLRVLFYLWSLLNAHCTTYPNNCTEQSQLNLPHHK